MSQIVENGINILGVSKTENVAQRGDLLYVRRIGPISEKRKEKVRTSSK
jgi:hypothetical protein